MPADLRVTAINLPAPLRAPCRIAIEVTFVNDGSDATIPGPFDVSVDITNSNEVPFASRFRTRVDREASIAPGDSLTVRVRVQFPCLRPVWVRAEADTFRQIPNNAHSFPPFGMSVAPDLVPWLATSLRVGLRDSVGTITWDPQVLCPNKELVAELLVRNIGCAAPPPTSTAVTMEDAAGNVVASSNFAIPAVTPGSMWTTLWSAPTPAAGAATTLVVRACADVNKVVIDQCDRSPICAVVTKPIASGSPPQLTLAVGGEGFVRPGEVPALSWSLINDCADLGMVTVRILFGTTAIFSSQESVGLRTSINRDLDPTQITIPSAIANTFWQIGSHVLTLEVTGTGLDPGPYQTTVNLEVRAEVVDFEWLFSLSSMRSWKSVYTVSFRFFNPAFAPMTLISLDALVHPRDQNNTASDVIRTPDGGGPQGVIAPGSSAAGTFTAVEAWGWTGPPLFYRTAPVDRFFDYTLRFGMLDAFGNSYPTMAMELATVEVAVSTSKLAAQGWALGLCTAGSILVAAGIACAIIFQVYPAILVCAGIAATGMALLISGFFKGYEAMDPPLPDFRLETGSAIADRAWDLPPSDGGDPAIYPLNSLTQLLGRIDAASLTLNRTRDRALAAYIDGDDGALRRLQQECRATLARLRRGIEALAGVLVDVQAILDERLASWQPSLEKRTGKTLVDGAHDLAERLKVPETDFAIVESVLSKVTESDLEAGLKAVRGGGLVRLSGEFQKWLTATEEEFAGFEFLK